MPSLQPAHALVQTAQTKPLIGLLWGKSNAVICDLRADVCGVHQQYRAHAAGRRVVDVRVAEFDNQTGKTNLHFRADPSNVRMATCICNRATGSTLLG
jgi:hypothetical protein